MKRRAAKPIVLVALFAGLGAAGGAAEDRYYWEGTLELQAQAEGAPCYTGVFDTRWKATVRWEEADRIDVHDRQGNLVGQFARLKEMGSEWSGTESGYHAHAISGGYQEDTYSGSGSGANGTLSRGCVYYRMSDRDPLAEVLANGAYALGVGAQEGGAVFGTRMLTVITRADGRKDAHTLDFPRAAMFQYSIGELVLGMNVSRWTGPVVAEEKKPFLSGMRMPGFDQEACALVDGRMTGSFEQRVASPPDAHQVPRAVRNTMKWDIGRHRFVDCRLEKVDSFWRPKGGEEANTVPITARIEEPGIRGKFRFTLQGRSREKGWALNGGEPGDTAPDLAFAPGQAGFGAPEALGDDERIETTAAVESATVTVECRDYGAWAELKAEVNVDGSWQPCRPEDGKDGIAIPLDENGDHIQDRWLDNWAEGEAAADDQDDEPEGVGDPAEPGDGFSNYEEYRGFVVDGKWLDTLPSEKDVFIHDSIGLGIGKFAQLGLRHHLIRQDEYDGNRVVNFNRGEASAGEQKGIYLRSKANMACLGEVNPCVGSPNVVDEVLIADGASLERSRSEGMLSAPLAETVGHELGHAVNIMHHGMDYPSWKGRAANVTAEQERDARTHSVATQGGIWSGDLECIMLYDSPYFYVGRDGILYLYPFGEVPHLLTKFCDQKAGTGVNAAGSRTGPNGEPYPVAGDARWGCCKRSVDLKGRHRNGDVSIY